MFSRTKTIKSIILIVALTVIAVVAVFSLKSATFKPALAAENSSSSVQTAWTKRCDKKTKHCEIFQRLIVKEKKQRLIEMAVGYPGKGKNPQAVILLPFGILISKGITLQLDNQKPLPAPIQTCGPVGCVSILNIAPDLLKVMNNSKALYISFANANGKVLRIQLSLQGFEGRLASL